ncbi:MAG: hypothetical protein KF902_13345 [Phycisphaeraceae bacterium]|nr:hypothetical protein [Phycisphaeraceae bacterium]MCW5769216.1 hypothetical protein [Phycisphaeraceae bacterium]
MSSKGTGESGGGLLSLATGAQAADQQAPGAPPAKRVSSQAVVLGAVLAGAAAFLFGMRHMGMGPQLSLANLKIEYERVEEGADGAARTARVLKELESAAKPVQIKGEELGRNPFRLTRAAAPTENLSDEGWRERAEADALAREAEAARKAMEAANNALSGEFAKLRLYSIMGGRVPLARLNDETVTVGDVVGNRFTVVSIEGRSVTLEAEGKQFTLSLEDQREQSARAKAKSAAASRRR